MEKERLDAGMGDVDGNDGGPSGGSGGVGGGGGSKSGGIRSSGRRRSRDEARNGVAADAMVFASSRGAAAGRSGKRKVKRRAICSACDISRALACLEIRVLRRDVAQVRASRAAGWLMLCRKRSTAIVSRWIKIEGRPP